MGCHVTVRKSERPSVRLSVQTLGEGRGVTGHLPPLNTKASYKKVKLLPRCHEIPASIAELARAVDVMIARAKIIYILMIKVNEGFNSFSSRCFLKEIENMFFVFVWSYRNAR